MDKLVVRGTEINVQWNPIRDDYISLTDIARIKDSDNPRYIIQNPEHIRLDLPEARRMILCRR